VFYVLSDTSAVSVSFLRILISYIFPCPFSHTYSVPHSLCLLFRIDFLEKLPPPSSARASSDLEYFSFLSTDFSRFFPADCLITSKHSLRSLFGDCSSSQSFPPSFDRDKPSPPEASPFSLPPSSISSIAFTCCSHYEVS